MDFSAAHIHLLLNHVPTVGFAIGLTLLVFGLLLNSNHLKVASLVTLVAIALLTMPVYATGSGAQQQICGPLGADGPCDDVSVPRVLIEMHESMAFVSYLLIVLVGGLAWLGLWRYRRLGRIPAWNTGTVLALALVAFATVAQAAAIGGEIRHPEIRVTAEAIEPPVGRVVSDFINNSVWTWAANETLHLIGLTLLMTVVLLVNLKMLGFTPRITYAAVDRLLPWGILGFGLNAITGMMFFLALPSAYVGNSAFDWKLVLLMVAGANMLLLTLDHGWEREGQPAPARLKALAGSGLVLWVAVMFWGSMLPFFGLVS
jgi:hypothetical protein